MKRILSILALSLIALSCNKEKAVKGIVHDFGPIELDGCGWVIEVNDEILKPEELATAYRQEGLEITFDYKLEGYKANCGLQTMVHEAIRITKYY